jgi:hypothetical protein
MEEEKNKESILYNLYIRVDEDRQILLAQNSDDINSIFNSVNENQDYLWIDGRNIKLSYDTFKIYDTSKALNSSSKSWLKDEIEKQKENHSMKMGIGLLKIIGRDVTSEFKIPISKKLRLKPMLLLCQK